MDESQLFGALPDDVLVQILGELPFKERHRALPLVCRRWRRLVVAPELVRRVTFDSMVEGGVAEPARLLRVAARGGGRGAARAGHVECVDMAIGTPYHHGTIPVDSPYPGSADTPAFFPEIVRALTACGPSLRRVRLYLQFLPDLRWPAALAAALPNVTALCVNVEEGSLALAVPLEGMRQLSELRLDASPSFHARPALEVSPRASLPPSLTKLHLGGLGWSQQEGDALPPQLSSLTRLRDLALHQVEHGPQGYAALGQLGSCLERLRLNWVSWLPSAATFARLTRLTMLSVDTVGEQREAFDDFTDSMEDTLAALPQLQHLLCTFASSGYEVDVPGMPRALTRLHNLQHLWWDIPAVVDLSLPGPSDAWLHGLRRLALTPAAITANGTRLLAATPRLQRLDVLECDAQSDAPLRFAVAHPSVQQVHVSVPTFPSYLARPLGPHEQQLEWARQQRPDVRFTCSRGALFECGPAFDGEEPSLGDELRDSRD